MGNYSRGPMGTTLPTVTTDLRDVYDSNDLAAVLTVNDGLYSIQPASGQYPGHLYKVTILSDTMWYNWTGKVGVATSTLAAHFQIYNNNTADFVTITTNNSTAANTNFTFAGTQAVSVANGYKDGSNVVCCRVYQEFSSGTPELIGSYTEANYDIAASRVLSGDGTGAAYGAGFQTFKPSSSYKLTSVKFYLLTSGSPAGNIYCRLYAHTGTFGTGGKPATVLGTYIEQSSTVINANTLSGTPELKEFTFAGTSDLTADTAYCLCIVFTSGDATNYVIQGEGWGDNTGIWGNDGYYNWGDWTGGTATGNEVVIYIYGTPA